MVETTHLKNMRSGQIDWTSSPMFGVKIPKTSLSCHRKKKKHEKNDCAHWLIHLGVRVFFQTEKRPYNEVLIWGTSTRFIWRNWGVKRPEKTRIESSKVTWQFIHAIVKFHTALPAEKVETKVETCVFHPSYICGWQPEIPRVSQGTCRLDVRKPL